MIRTLSGVVRFVTDDFICLDVAGFGLEVFASGSLLAQARDGEQLTCRAWLQVSDAGMALFGFSSETERELFLEITQVKTMGGKLSIALLRHLDSAAIVRAIVSGDPARLAVPGLGAKRAERICFELRPKVEKKFAGLAFASGGPAPHANAEVLAGLVGLGFSRLEAQRSISESIAESGPDIELSEEALMRAALAKLQKAAGGV